MEERFVRLEKKIDALSLNLELQFADIRRLLLGQVRASGKVEAFREQVEQTRQQESQNKDADAEAEASLVALLPEVRKTLSEFRELPCEFLPPQHLQIAKASVHPLLTQTLDMLRKTSPDLNSVVGNKLTMEAISTGLDYVQKYVDLALDHWTDEALAQIGNSSTQSAYQDIYRATHAAIKAQEVEAYQRLVPTVEAVKVQEYASDLEGIPDPFLKVQKLYEQSWTTLKQCIEPMVLHISEKLSGTQQKIGPIKGLFRLLEKLVLRPKVGLPWDIIRALFVCDSMSGVVEALKVITSYPGLKVVTINDRFSSPKAGWADVAIYIQFENERYKNTVAEIQIAHRKMVVVREHLGAHDAYDDGRFASELLFYKSSGSSVALPWSLQAAQVSPAEEFGIQTGFYTVISAFPWCKLLLLWFEGNTLFADAICFSSDGSSIQEERVNVFSVSFEPSSRSEGKLKATLHLPTDSDRAATKCAVEVQKLPSVVPGALGGGICSLFQGLEKVVPCWLQPQAGFMLKLLTQQQEQNNSLPLWEAAAKRQENHCQRMIRELLVNTFVLPLSLTRSSVDYILNDAQVSGLPPGLYVGKFGDMYGQFSHEVFRAEYSQLPFEECDSIFKRSMGELRVPTNWPQVKEHLPKCSMCSFLVISKVTGDVHVPAGQITYVAPLGIEDHFWKDDKANIPEHIDGFGDVLGSYFGYQTYSMVGFQSPEWYQVVLLKSKDQGGRIIFGFCNISHGMSVKPIRYMDSQTGPLFKVGRDVRK